MASIALAADGPWEDFEEKSTSPRAASLYAIQIIAPGVLSLWMTASKEGEDFPTAG